MSAQRENNRSRQIDDDSIYSDKDPDENERSPDRRSIQIASYGFLVLLILFGLLSAIWDLPPFKYHVLQICFGIGVAGFTASKLALAWTRDAQLFPENDISKFGCLAIIIVTSFGAYITFPLTKKIGSLISFSYEQISSIRLVAPDILLPWFGWFALSCVVPFAIFVSNSSTRAQRRETVRDLERLIGFARLPNETQLVTPLFELVKYKYDPDTNPTLGYQRNPHVFAYYVLPVIIYIAVSMFGFCMAFTSYDLAINPFFSASQNR